MGRSEDAEAAALRTAASESVSVDWVKGKGNTKLETANKWDVKKPGDDGYGHVPAYGNNGWDPEDDGWGPPQPRGRDNGWGRYDDGYSSQGNYDGDEGVSSDWERPGRERKTRPVTMQDGTLNDGDEVTVKVIARTPLGFALEVNGKYDGLTYHSDVFQQPPEVGWEGPAWVTKVRRDGKMDVSLRPPGAHRKIADGAARILLAMESNNGFLGVGDRSDPDSVYQAVRNPPEFWCME